jgi:hypothetical protein
MLWPPFCYVIVIAIRLRRPSGICLGDQRKTYRLMGYLHPMLIVFRDSRPPASLERTDTPSRRFR